MLKGIVKNLIGNAGEILDEVVTTDEERLEAKRKLKELMLSHQAQMEQNITDRWKADMNSDSWLSKNVRPLMLIFVMVCTMLLIFIDAGFLSFEVESKWVDLLQLVLITIVASYFGGRSLEKVKKK
jgi:cation transport ATPase|tara:strand:+ start:323 stop:700 length:378 start_codon:yes stop_codon:yes gene_type:complete